MRTVIFVLVLMLTSFAGADELVLRPLRPQRHLDTGAKVAIAGASLVMATWAVTSLAAVGNDLTCGLSSGLGEHYVPCPSHTWMVVPFAGGIINATQNHDGSQIPGIFSSALQIAGLGMIVGGVAGHHWQTAGGDVSLAPYVGVGTAGVTGRF
jgi:hypothetical protein